MPKAGAALRGEGAMRWIVVVSSILFVSTPAPAADDGTALEQLGRMLVLQEAAHRRQGSYSSNRRDLGLEPGSGGVSISSADRDGWRAILETPEGRWTLAIDRGPSMAEIRDRVRRELRDLVTRQARHRAQAGVYADRPEDLGVRPEAEIRITANDDSGWAADATRPLFVDRNCVIRVGSIRPRPETRRDGRRGFPGQSVCDRPAEGIYDREQRERAYREMGRALQHYLDRQQTALDGTGGFMPELEVRNPDGTIVRTFARPEPTRLRAAGAHEAIGRVTWELTLERVRPSGSG